MSDCRTEVVSITDHHWEMSDMFWDEPYEQFRITITCSKCERSGWGWIDLPAMIGGEEE